MNVMTDSRRTLRHAGLRLAATIRLHAPRLILVAYVVLAFIYSAVTPVFEAPDENYHFAFIQYLALSDQLPVQDPAIKTPWYQEGSQPPLYYLLGSLIARIVPAPDDPYPLAVNPHAEIGIGLAQINHNFFAHTSTESFPWRGIPLQVHLVRLLGIALGACTVYAAYRTARLALPHVPAIAPLVMAFVAFNPMFLFVSGSINNDNLVTTCGALVSWLTLAVYRQSSLPAADRPVAALGLGSGAPRPQQSGSRRWLGLIGLLGIVLALGSLSKISGLTLYIAPGALLLLLRYKRQISWRQLMAAVGLFALTFVVLAGWWYVRNWQLYGDPTGLNTMIAIIQPRKTPYTLATMFEEMQGLRISFWALFGWFNVIGPQWFLGLMDTLTLVASLGCLVWVCLEVRARRGGSLIPVGLLGLQLLVTFASLINWTRMTPGTQGRLLFPAITAIAILMVSGWYALEDLFHLLGTSRITIMGVRTQAMKLPRVRTAFAKDAESTWINHALLAAGSLTVVGFVALFSPLTIRNAYAPPPTVARLPDDAVPVQVRFDKIEIAGFRIDRTPILPGGQLPITIYYRGEPDARNLSLSLTALDWQGHAAGKIDTYPGGGNLPTSRFEPGKLYMDSYRLPIDSTLNGPVQGKIELGLWDFGTKEHVKPVQADGTPLEALILRGGTILSAVGAPQPAVAQPAVFSGALRLNGYTLVPGERGETSVLLVWEALSPVYEDFMVFLHLETDAGKVVDQDDGPPLRDNYPTSAWAVKQPFADLRSVRTTDLPPGTYRLTVGLYRARDNSRLPVDTGGDMVILKTPITVK